MISTCHHHHRRQTDNTFSTTRVTSDFCSTYSRTGRSWTPRSCPCKSAVQYRRTSWRGSCSCWGPSCLLEQGCSGNTLRRTGGPEGEERGVEDMFTRILCSFQVKTKGWRFTTSWWVCVCVCSCMFFKICIYACICVHRSSVATCIHTVTQGLHEILPHLQTHLPSSAWRIPVSCVPSSIPRWSFRWAPAGRRPAPPRLQRNTSNV